MFNSNNTLFNSKDKENFQVNLIRSKQTQQCATKKSRYGSKNMPENDEICTTYTKQIKKTMMQPINEEVLLNWYGEPKPETVIVKEYIPKTINADKSTPIKCISKTHANTSTKKPDRRGKSIASAHKPQVMNGFNYMLERIQNIKHQ